MTNPIQYPKRTFARKMFCCQRGEISNVLWILSSYQRLKCLIQPCAVTQLDKLNNAINQKWLELVNCIGVVFHRHNVRPHMSFVIHQNPLERSQDVLSHSQYLITVLPTLQLQITVYLALCRILCIVKLSILTGQNYATGTVFRFLRQDILPAWNRKP